MTPQCQSTTFKIPLTERFHQTAQQFYQHHGDPDKAKQIYLNTLCVQTVQFYLTCLGIGTDLEQSNSWDPVLQVLSNGADLWVNDLGRLECRPVLPGQTDWEIPAETWDDRIGYIFVQLDQDLAEATLLGFLDQAAAAAVTAECLQPIDNFPAYLATQKQTTAIIQPVTKLQQWLNQIVDDSWTSLEQIFAEWPTPAYSFRHSLTNQALIESATNSVKQGKLLKLSQAALLFVVGIAPTQDSSAFDITIELYPVGQQSYLPSSLQLVVMDEEQIPVLQAEGRQSEGLEFQFSAEVGENFAVQISLNQAILTEVFAI